MFVFLLLLNTSFSFGESQLVTALNAYEKGQYDAARSSFLSLSQDPSYAFMAYYNLGNIAVKQQKPGEALGYYKKALKFKPRDSALNFNILFVLNQFKISPPTGNISFFDILKQEVLSKFTFYEISFLTFIFLLVFFYSFIKFFKLKVNKDAPSHLPLQLIGVGFVLTACLFMLTLKLVDSYTDRAIVTVKSELKSGPNESNAALTDLQEGLEVQIVNVNGPWHQVTIPGSLTGWVQGEKLMQTSGEGPW